jgi:hypothetical protein
MNYFRSILILCIVFLLCSCTMIYDVTKIPRTPDNLKAARECQHTAATAVGYSQEGYWELKESCYKTLDNTTRERVSEYPHSIQGCELFDDWGEADWRYFYFLCKP